MEKAEKHYNDETIYRKAERRKRRQKVHRRYFLRGVFFTVLLELIIYLLVPVYHTYFPVIQEGHLMRNISEVANHLLEDIQSIPYEAQVPAFIQKDIDSI